MTFHERTVRQTSSADSDVVQRTDQVTTTDPTPTRDPTVIGRTDRVISETRVQPSRGELTRRIVVLVFGIIQVLIALRIGLLLLDARESNGLVNLIYTMSQLFVVPFEGIFHTNALRSGGAVLDIAAIAALVGWSVLEAIVFWAVNLFRREPTI